MQHSCILLDPSGSVRLDIPVYLPSLSPDEELPVPAMVTVAGESREWMAAVKWLVAELPVACALTLDW